jgi:hypothetical protein
MRGTLRGFNSMLRENAAFEELKEGMIEVTGTQSDSQVRF